MELGRNYVIRVESLRDLIEIYDGEVAMLEREIHSHLREHSGYRPFRRSTVSARPSRR